MALLRLCVTEHQGYGYISQIENFRRRVINWSTSSGPKSKILFEPGPNPKNDLKPKTNLEKVQKLFIFRRLVIKQINLN